MSDKLFFPLAFLLAAVFVFIALNPYADRPPAGPVSGGGHGDDVTVTGAQLHRFVAGVSGGVTANAGTISIVTPEGSKEPVARLTRLVEQVYDNPESGPHLVLAEDLEFAFETRPVEVTVVARSAGDFGASAFEANYMARPGAGGQSGWKPFPLTANFTPYTFCYTPPRRGDTEGYDYFGVRPVTPDKHRTMEIQSIRFHTLGPKGSSCPGQKQPTTPNNIPFP